MRVPRPLEDEAERLLRHAARDRLPVDAGAVAKLHGVVREAFDAGRASVTTSAQNVLSAYQRFLDEDDLEGLRDALTQLQEAIQ